MKPIYLLMAAFLVFYIYLNFVGGGRGKIPVYKGSPGERITRTDEEWGALLTEEQYRILRQAGTERAFSGVLWNNHEQGVYVCAGCGKELFLSDAKYDSGTGWPSFYEPAEETSVETADDNSFLMRRTEVRCGRCGGHLGHVFDDGPAPTGLRFCINSAALKFQKAQ